MVVNTCRILDNWVSCLMISDSGGGALDSGTYRALVDAAIAAPFFPPAVVIRADGTPEYVPLPLTSLTNVVSCETTNRLEIILSEETRFSAILGIMLLKDPRFCDEFHQNPSGAS